MTATNMCSNFGSKWCSPKKSGVTLCLIGILLVIGITAQHILLVE